MQPELVIFPACSPTRWRMMLCSDSPGEGRFRRYVVEFTSGNRLHVRHPETVFWRGAIYFHISPRGEYRIFDHTEVAQVMDVQDTVPTINDEMDAPEGDDTDGS